MRRRSIAVVGAGISGLVAAHELSKHDDVTVYDANDYAGGHTNTVDVDLGGQRWAIDTGFIVFNEPAYPNFVRLMNELGVATQPSSMTFSVSCVPSGIEWGGTGLAGLFAQPTNALRPGFWRMLRDIRRFARVARELLDHDSPLSLGEYLSSRDFSREFTEQYLVPMSAAIWSATPEQILRVPASFFVRFFDNHGVLDIRNAPVWRVIRGGSRSYIAPLTARYADRIRLSNPVTSVRRENSGVTVCTQSGACETYDAVVLATHSDQALAMLEQPTRVERDVLGAIPYQLNDVVLHTDETLMPARRRAWASWNYHVPADPADRVTVTYYMNMLQDLRDAPASFLVTLNRTQDIDPARILRRFNYQHPLFTSRALAAQKRHAEIDGVGGVHFCGAYWGNGFHEDGVESALTTCRRVRQRAAA